MRASPAPIFNPPLLLRRVVLSLAAILVAGIFIELSLRLLTLRPGQSALFCEQPNLGFRMRPHLSLEGIATNSFGFNDKEHPREAPQNTRRLALLGDSFVFGVVSRPQNLSGALQRLLDSEGQSVEVLNLGVPAAGPHTYVSVLRNETIELDVDIVFLVFFVGNDIAQSHPHFTTRVFMGAPRELLADPFMVRWSTDYFYLFRLFRASGRLLREKLRSRPSSGAFTREAFLNIEYQRAQICRRNLTLGARDSYRNAIALIQMMEKTAVNQGMGFVLVLAPDQVQVDLDLRGELAARYDLDLTDYDFNQPQRIIKDALTSSATPTLDLLGAFRNSTAQDPLFLERDTHWNVDGNDHAARQILSFFLASPTVDKDPAPLP